MSFMCTKHCVQTGNKDEMLFYGRFACHDSLIIHTQALMRLYTHMRALLSSLAMCHDGMMLLLQG